MNQAKHDEIRQAVRENYGAVARADSGCGCGTACCTPGELPAADILSRGIGYRISEVSAVPEGANLGLGCGNPQAIAALKPGETVLDLGSGAGFDCFLAARQVGGSGQVIGVDMTPDMLSKARANATKGGYIESQANKATGFYAETRRARSSDSRACCFTCFGLYTNVTFRLGEIEHLPVADAMVDVIISNCVINLSPDKSQVFRDAFRVLKNGGRLAISDIVATAELPEEARRDLALYTGCMAGASLIGNLETMMKHAGFEQVRITPKDESRAFIRDWAPGRKIEDFVVSANIEAIKP